MKLLLLTYKAYSSLTVDHVKSSTPYGRSAAGTSNAQTYKAPIGGYESPKSGASQKADYDGRGAKPDSGSAAGTYNSKEYGKPRSETKYNAARSAYKSKSKREYVTSNSEPYKAPIRGYGSPKSGASQTAHYYRGAKPYRGSAAGTYKSKPYGKPRSETKYNAARSAYESKPNREYKTSSEAYGALASDNFQCASGHQLFSRDLSESAYEEIYNDVKKMYMGIDGGKKSEFVGCILRVAAHDFLDYRPTAHFGGSDGCLDMGIDQNKGLEDCLGKITSEDITTIYAKHCQRVNIPDFIVIAAEAAMAITAPCENTMKKSFLANFKWGRKWCGKTGNAALAQQKKFAGIPQTHKQSNDPGRDTFNRLLKHNVFSKFTSTHARFYNNSQGKGELSGRGNGDSSGNVSLADVMSVAILGGHTLGRAMKDHRGASGWWSDIRNQGVFNNDYYKSLLAKGWVLSNEGKMWERADIGKSSTPEMMLAVDLTNMWVVGTHRCCLFSPVSPGFQSCGNERNCCGKASKCNIRQTFTKDVVLQFAKNQNVFYDYFLKAWYVATTNNQNRLRKLSKRLETRGNNVECYSWGCEFFRNGSYFNQNSISMIKTVGRVYLPELKSNQELFEYSNHRCGGVTDLGFTFSNSNRAQSFESCQDTAGHCEKVVSLGLCEDQEVQAICAKTCGLCTSQFEMILDYDQLGVAMITTVSFLLLL